MTLLDEKKDLINHLAWADAIVWQAVLALDNPQDESKFKELLHHLHTVQHAFLQIWRGDKMSLTKLADYDNLQQICQWASTFHVQWDEFSAGLQDNDLQQIITVPWAGHLVRNTGKKPQPTTLLQLINQVIMHSAYHRGQVNTLVRQNGGEPPLTDLIMWNLIGNPAAEWPAA